MRHAFLPPALAFFGLLSHPVFAKNLPELERYVAEYLPFAIAHAAPRGIPISICLGQAIVESAYGKSPLAQQANNHFGMKKGSTWAFGIVEKMDDEYNEKGQMRLSKFRKYWSVEDSYLDYCENLRRFDVYRSLFSIPKTDYRAWAFGLKKCGYASSRKYVQLLIDVIEAGELFNYDRPRKGQIGQNEPAVLKKWRLESVKKGAEKYRASHPKKPEPSEPKPFFELVFCRFLNEEKEKFFSV